MNNRLSKIISGALSATLLLESCENSSLIYQSADELNQLIINEAVSTDSTAIPIRIQLSDKNVEYCIFLQQLATDILAHPEIAESFINNPNKYLSEHGFDSQFANLDSQLTKLILTLADNDVCNAINNQDISGYLAIMKEKGLIEEITITDIDELTSLSNTTFLFDQDLSDNSNLQVSAALFFPAVVVGVAVAVWAAVIEHLFIGNAVFLATAVTVAAAVNVVVNGNYNRVYETLVTTNTIEAFSIKSQNSDNVRLLADEYIEQTVDSTLEYIKKTYPIEYQKHNETELKNAIILNLENSLYD